MEILILSLLSFSVAILTFFSGFGLGTILTPVFMIFFPVESAIALTGIVHFCNNIFKLFLVGRHATTDVLLRFGVPAIVAAFIGSWLLVHLTDLPALFSYEAFGYQFTVYPVKFIVAILLAVFAGIDLIPGLQRIQFGRDKLPIGGIISGFFGGLSGNQGALRSAFLSKIGLTKEAFLGTTVVVSTFVDITRLSVYASTFAVSGLSENLEIVLWATLSAIAGAYIGNILLKKVTLHFLQMVIAYMLIVLSIALGAGVL